MKAFALAAALLLTSPAFAQTNDHPSPGGYRPAGSMWVNGAPKPGDKVVFEPSKLTPSEAFPAPAPLAHYPLCKRGQTDECMQRGGR
ncbi:hypothetical protein ACX40Y_11785 [Sphingomonas sp. RS6]